MEYWVCFFVACYGLRVAGHALESLVCNVLPGTRNAKLEALQFHHSNTPLLHYCNAPYIHFRLIIDAIYPAPNPLSMLTTATFELQLFSIANSAVKPPRLTP